MRWFGLFSVSGPKTRDYTSHKLLRIGFDYGQKRFHHPLPKQQHSPTGYIKKKSHHCPNPLPFRQNILGLFHGRKWKSLAWGESNTPMLGTAVPQFPPFEHSAEKLAADQICCFRKLSPNPLILQQHY